MATGLEYGVQFGPGRLGDLRLDLPLKVTGDDDLPAKPFVNIVDRQPTLGQMLVIKPLNAVVLSRDALPDLAIDVSVDVFVRLRRKT